MEALLSHLPLPACSLMSPPERRLPVLHSSSKWATFSIPHQPPPKVVSTKGNVICVWARQNDSTKRSHAVAENVASVLADVEFSEEQATVSRNDFPADFAFGTATSAFQVEGACREGGRGISIWDTFMYQPGRIADGSNASIACDYYQTLSEDVQMIQSLGVDAYRFSISWSRLFPDGANINPQAVDYYNYVINRVVGAGLTPYVTIYHWDLPQTLENDPDVLGWRTENIIPHYTLFSDACFRHFGDRVKHWITINELHITSIQGYGVGRFAPGRCSSISGNSCPAGDSSTEPYIVMHNQLLSHVAAVKTYKIKYQGVQKGKIGVTFDSFWSEPYTQTKPDIEAAQRNVEFELGWQMDPVVTGDYPKIMKERVGERLPKFTEAQSEQLKGSFDFIGINYYTSFYVKDNPNKIDPDKRWWGNDMGATTTYFGPDGKPIGIQMGPADNPWLYDCPWGLRKLLAWIDNRYGKIPIYITENGTMDDNPEAPLNQILDDHGRIRYLKGHLRELSRVMKEKKLDVRGYFVWSLMDNFEWASGYSCRFGLFYVDFHGGKVFQGQKLQRLPKHSAKWYHEFLRPHGKVMDA